MSIFDLFAKSPFKPLQEHMAAVRECAGEMVPLLEAVCSGDRDRLSEVERRIDEIEGRADQLKNDLRAHLPKRLLLPVDRRDLLEILDLQDSIADRLQDVAELLVQRPTTVPESMRTGLLDLGRAAHRTCEQCAELIGTLDELVETGFRGREAERVERMIDELGRLEGEADKHERELTRELFRLEDSESAVSVMLWYQLLGWIGNVADLAEKVGNRIRLLIAR